MKVLFSVWRWLPKPRHLGFVIAHADYQLKAGCDGQLTNLGAIP